jgi:hypothetical protein
VAMSVSDLGQGHAGRESFPNCEICGAVVRRQLMRLHHAWHDDIGYSPHRRPGNEASSAPSLDTAGDQANDTDGAN